MERGTSKTQLFAHPPQGGDADFSSLDYWEASPTIKAAIELFSRNLQETIDFLDNACTADRLSWISEVFKEIFAKLKS